MTSNRNWSNIVKLFSIASAMLALTVCPIANAEVRETYTDKIYLKNGDRLTGNIKELDRGKLRLKTLTMDTVYLNWVDTESVESDKYLRITNTDGTFNYGRIKKSDIAEDLVVIKLDEQVEVPVVGVATIRPIRTNESV